jgi:hypothetical protein
MKNFFQKLTDIDKVKHQVGGALLFILTFIAATFLFAGDGIYTHFSGYLFSFVVTFLVACAWEIVRLYTTKNNFFDWQDVWATMLGALYGAVLVSIYLSIF